MIEYDLDPKETHYLKRELVTQEIHSELEKLVQSASFQILLDQNTPLAESELPFLRYIFNTLVLDFPFLKKEQDDKFWVKCETFLTEFQKRRIASSDKNEQSQRKKMEYKMEKMIVILLGAAIKTVQGKEEGIKVDQQMLSQSKTEEQKRQDNRMTRDLIDLENEDAYMQWVGTNGLDINIVTVREVGEKRTLREKPHAEFIVQTYFEHDEDPNQAIYVAKRHGQFRQLQDDLKKKFPTIDIPHVPAKSRDSENSHAFREKDRLSLRAFLHRVAIHPRLADSDVFLEFLRADPIQVNEEERNDMENRKRIDKIRLEEEKKFKVEVDKQVEQLNEQLETLKKQVIAPGGLTEMFNDIKTSESIQDLPSSLQTAFEWGKINFAFVLHTHFVTSDAATENLMNLKRTHALIPYRTLRTILKISNPMAMVKGVLDLFMAQPFGGRSLFQRIIMANLIEETKEAQKNIDTVEKTIDDPGLCKKIYNSVYEASDAIVEIEENEDLSPIMKTLSLLQNDDIEPPLTAQQITKVAFAAQKNQKESRRLVKRLHQLYVLYMRKRDQEMLTELVFQGNTGDLLKDIFAIFYQPLAQVYKAANIGDSIVELSAFIDDLILFVEQIDVDDVGNTVQPFIQLITKHEHSFYRFVHNVHAQDKTGLFDDLLAYIDKLFSMMANGLPGKVDMEKLVKENLEDPQYPDLKKEINTLCDYHLERKIKHMQRTRRKVLEGTGINAELEVDSEQTMLELMGDKNATMGVMDDMEELDFLSDSDLSDDEEDALYSSDDSIDENQDEAAVMRKEQQRRQKLDDESAIPPPKLSVLPKLKPAFTRAVASLMT
ncbi:hypothetical protein NQZ79_g8289 [Umbelopsis isabellina]|nr:hypothetical protein NQZ79_g8289 [Umbelopsis isabellina]